MPPGGLNISPGDYKETLMGHEERLAEKVVAYLHDLQWDVYQEVKVKESGNIADIVAVQGRRIWIIETKMSFSLALISQAMEWRKFAHWVSVAVPTPKLTSSWKGRDCGEKILDTFGVGVLWVDSYGQIVTRIRPKLFRQAFTDFISQNLYQEQKTYAKAGNDRSEYYSPFRRTCNLIAKTVSENPGINLKTLIEKVDHHYASVSSARSSIRHWAEAGKIRGIRMERDGRFIKFYPTLQTGKGKNNDNHRRISS